MDSSTRGRELVLRFSVEVGGVMALVQLGRGLPVDAIDHPPALYRRSFKKLISPALYVSVVLYTQEFSRSVEPAFRQSAIPGKNGHVRYRIGAASDVLTLGQSMIEHVELPFHLHGKAIDSIFNLLR